MQQQKKIDLNFVHEYIEMNLQQYGKDPQHLSKDEGNWFVSQLLQLEQVEALQRIADALEAIASSPKL